MTPLQQDPSAQAPWTRMMFGRPFTCRSLPSSSCGTTSVAGRRAVAHRTTLRFESCSKGVGYARREERMPTVPAREFHGRDAELALVRGELDRLSDGAEAVGVIEGAAGMAKSRLHAELASIARSLR